MQTGNLPTNILVRYNLWDTNTLRFIQIDVQDVFAQLYRIILDADSNLQYSNDVVPFRSVHDLEIDLAIKRAIFSITLTTIGKVYDEDRLKVKRALFEHHYLVAKTDGQTTATPFGMAHFDEIKKHRQYELNTKKGERNTIFISYSHEDSKLFGELKTSLTPLLRDGTLTCWDDTMIKSGDRWEEKIIQAICKAKVFILLVSRNFLASDFIAKKEFPAMLEVAESEEARIGWIALSPSLYNHTPIAKYQAMFDPSKPLKALSPVKRDAVWKQIVENLLDMFH